MIYSAEVQHMCPVAKGAYHGPAPIPEEGKWGAGKGNQRHQRPLPTAWGWCAPQQGACKLTLNVKNGIIEEALVETLGCSGMTHSAAMASEILIGKTILEALNTDLVCDAINTAMRELFLQIVYPAAPSPLSLRMVWLSALPWRTWARACALRLAPCSPPRRRVPRYLEMAEGYCTRVALNKDNEIIGYEFINLGKMMDAIKGGMDANEAMEKAKGHYGQFENAASTSIRVTNKRGGQRKWLCLKATREESTRSTVSSPTTVSRISRSAAPFARRRASIPTRLSRAFSPSALRMPPGLTAWVSAIALKKGVKTAAEAAKAIGEGLQAFCIDGSVADDRKVGIGHGNLGAMLLSDESKCFAFLAGHESFAAAEGAIGIVKNANKARKEPLRVILNGLGKDAAQIISRINGFTYVQTQFDYATGKVNIVKEIRYSEGERANVRCYGANRYV